MLLFLRMYEKLIEDHTVLYVVESALIELIDHETDYDNGISYDTKVKHYNLTSNNLLKILKKVTPTCKDYLTNCSWDGKKVECHKIFKITATDAGFCCSFNYFPAKQKLSTVG